MKKNVLVLFVSGLILMCGPGLAQNGNLKLKSKVELNNWKLSSRAYKQEKFLNGASVKLYKAEALVSQTTSDQDGNFELDIPASGAYTIEVTYAGCNPKKFVANTRTIHTKAGDFPLVDITGMIMPKAIKTNDNLGLYQPLVKIEREHGNGF